LNQQRQTTPATIDLTPAHQVLRARIMGAIDCDPRFRIKSLSLEGNRTSSDPFSTGSDTIANHCATSDLLVSFDGSTTYMLQCEVKTTRKKFGDKTAPEIFRDIKHVEYPDSGKRNLRQFEKLCGGGSHYWWYVIAQVHGLNEDDQDQLESKIGDQPVVLIEGKAPYPEAIRQYGPMRLNALLKVVRERTGAIAEKLPMDQASATPLNSLSREQLAFPIDDVPVVTMNTPLYSKKPEQVERSASITPAAPAVVNNAGGWYRLPSESMCEVIKAVDIINAPIDIFAARLTYDEQLALNEVRCALGANPSDLRSINAVRSLFGVAPIGKISTDRRAAWAHAITPMALAVRLIAIRGKRERCGRHGEVFSELYALHSHNIKWRRNLAALIAMRLIE
jgi:hypothetical protein